MFRKRAGKGEQLDASIRAKYEKRFGVDLGHVRIYTGEFAEEFNRKRDAYALSVGATGMILMGGSPEKSMGSTEEQELEAEHEEAHEAGSATRAAADAGSAANKARETHEQALEELKNHILKI